MDCACGLGAWVGRELVVMAEVWVQAHRGSHKPPPKHVQSPTHQACMQYRPTHIHIGHQPLAPQPEEVTQDREDHQPQNRPESHPGFEALFVGVGGKD